MLVKNDRQILLKTAFWKLNPRKVTEFMIPRPVYLEPGNPETEQFVQI